MFDKMSQWKWMHYFFLKLLSINRIYNIQKWVNLFFFLFFFFKFLLNQIKVGVFFHFFCYSFICWNIKLLSLFDKILHPSNWGQLNVFFSKKLIICWYSGWNFGLEQVNFECEGCWSQSHTSYCISCVY